MLIEAIGLTALYKKSLSSRKIKESSLSNPNVLLFSYINWLAIFYYAYQIVS